jgi:hypothetical protein
VLRENIMFPSRRPDLDEKKLGVRDSWTRNVVVCMHRTVGRRDGGSTWFRRVHIKFEIQDVT